MITQKELQEIFTYKDGQLYWKTRPSNRVKIGSRAGRTRTDGYGVVSVKGKRYYIHRLVYLYHHGVLPSIIDHIDRNPSNNEDDASVDVSNCLLVPQGISPNGDRENDVLVIPCIESYPDNVLKIFNRNGTQIYEASNYLNTWDGRANMGFPESSRRLPVGTYFYVLQINGFENPIGGYIYLNY